MKKLMSMVLSLLLFVCLVGCGDSKPKVNIEELASGVITCFEDSIDYLEFIEKYAGNVNGSGSRKVADSMIDSIRYSLSGLDEALIREYLPLTGKKLDSLQEDIDELCDLLVDMGKTNSDKNVSKIKRIAGNIVDDMEDLIDDELLDAE